MKHWVIVFIGIAILSGCRKEQWEGEPVTGKRWKIDVLKYINNSYTSIFEEKLKLALTQSGFKEKRDFKIRIRSAQMVSWILKGEDATKIPFENDRLLTKHFRINETAAEQAKLKLPASLLSRQ